MSFIRWVHIRNESLAELLPRKSCLSETSISSEETKLYKERRCIPRVLDYQAQVVLPGEYNSFLDVLWSSRVDTDYWHASLFTRNPERGVEVAALDRPVGKCVRLVVGEFGGAR